jgi:hypothetical protein
LVTLAPFGPPWGGLFRWSGTPDSCFHWGSIVNSAFWQSRFAFSLWIYSELCVLAFRIRVFTEDL